MTEDRAWVIEKLVPGGAGMARLVDGSIGFADGALPGEHIQVNAVEAHRGYVRARGFQVLAPSSERVVPACPIAEACGGCDWLHLNYEAQLRHKAGLIAEALTRTGGFRALPPISVERSPRPLGYRLRIRLHIDKQGRVGFFAGKSHALVEVESCAAASPRLDAALAAFRRISASFPNLARHFEQAELRVSEFEPERSVRLTAVGVPLAAQESARAWLAALRAEFHVAIATLDADYHQRFQLADSLWLEASPHAFVQVNWEVNLKLVESVVGSARAHEVRRFLDVYAGAGNFTLPLVAAGLEGMMIEGHAQAQQSAVRTLSGRGAVVPALCEDAGGALRRLAAAREPFDLVLLDPPRAGAADVIESLLALRPSFIAYCSCDPVTLARDLKSLCRDHYELESVRGFDMFPGTHHVETLVWLTRRQPTGA